MKLRDEKGRFISWEQAAELANDPKIRALAEERDSLAWVLDIATWEEDTGIDPVDFERYPDYVDATEIEYAEEMEEDDWLEAGVDVELSVDTDGDIYTETT